MRMGFSLVKGKYAVDIMKKFIMLEHKVIATPMESNLKLLCDAFVKSVDAMMYCQMIGSLMYLTNRRPYICFVVNTLMQFLMDPIHALNLSGEHVSNPSRTGSRCSQQSICMVLYSSYTSMIQSSDNTSWHQPTLMKHHTKDSNLMT